MKKNSILKLLSLVLCFVLFAATALCIGYAETVTTPEQTEEEQNVTVLGTMFIFQVIDKEGNETVFEVHTDKKTVGEALLAYELIAGEDSAYGLYVKTVIGITADYNVDGTYWAFYINGEYAMTGVDSTEIEYGAVYTFRVE